MRPGDAGGDAAVRKCYQPRIATAFLPPPAPFPFLPSPSNRFQQFPKRKRRGGWVERESQRSGARLTLSLSPSRATAGQEDLEDAQQEVHGRGGATVAARLRASEPRHAAARAPLGARRARRLLAGAGAASPRARPRRPPGPAPSPPPPPLPPSPPRQQLLLLQIQPPARRSPCACVPQIGGDGTRRGAGNVDNANASAAGAPPRRGAQGCESAQICRAQALSAAVT